jgi:hypothetical protein
MDRPTSCPASSRTTRTNRSPAAAAVVTTSSTHAPAPGSTSSWYTSQVGSSSAGHSPVALTGVGNVSPCQEVVGASGVTVPDAGSAARAAPGRTTTTRASAARRHVRGVRAMRSSGRVGQPAMWSTALSYRQQVQSTT